MADSSHLPFRSLSAVRVLIVDALHHIRRQQETIDELDRILDKGGILVVDEPDLRSFAVKLIRIGELLLLMGSHFLTQTQLQNMFTGKKGVMKTLTWRGSLLLQFKKAK
jgi:demethylmenaquinone methyltransferase/2-methoxy-6-polyprenyl-1,4-benzoquinol methylase